MRKKDEGFVLIFMAALLPVLAMLMTLVFDSGSAYYHKAALQQACDSAALHAANTMATLNDQTKSNTNGTATFQNNLASINGLTTPTIAFAYDLPSNTVTATASTTITNQMGLTYNKNNSSAPLEKSNPTMNVSVTSKAQWFLNPSETAIAMWATNYEMANYLHTGIAGLYGCNTGKTNSQIYTPYFTAIPKFISGLGGNFSIVPYTVSVNIGNANIGNVSSMMPTGFGAVYNDTVDNQIGTWIGSNNVYFQASYGNWGATDLYNTFPSTYNWSANISYNGGTYPQYMGNIYFQGQSNTPQSGGGLDFPAIAPLSTSGSASSWISSNKGMWTTSYGGPTPYQPCKYNTANHDYYYGYNRTPPTNMPAYYSTLGLSWAWRTLSPNFQSAFIYGSDISTTSPMNYGTSTKSIVIFMDQQNVFCNFSDILNAYVNGNNVGNNYANFAIAAMTAYGPVYPSMCSTAYPYSGADPLSSPTSCSSGTANWGYQSLGSIVTPDSLNNGGVFSIEQVLNGNTTTNLAFIGGGSPHAVLGSNNVSYSWNRKSWLQNPTTGPTSTTYTYAGSGIYNPAFVAGTNVPNCTLQGGTTYPWDGGITTVVNAGMQANFPALIQNIVNSGINVFIVGMGCSSMNTSLATLNTASALATVNPSVPAHCAYYNNSASSLKALSNPSTGQGLCVIFQPPCSTATTHAAAGTAGSSQTGLGLSSFIGYSFVSNDQTLWNDSYATESTWAPNGNGGNNGWLQVVTKAIKDANNGGGAVLVK
jgi:Flp pilus assembly protein TadG